MNVLDLLASSILFLAMLAGSLLLGGCRAAMPPLETVDQVDLQRFMGDWYVIANIPTFVEKGAHNAVESYSLDEDGSIATTFTFRKGGFVWIMARTPEISEQAYQEMLQHVRESGYDLDQIRKVPQQWQP